MVCRKCGCELAEDALRCTECGAEVERFKKPIKKRKIIVKRVKAMAFLLAIPMIVILSIVLFSRQKTESPIHKVEEKEITKVIGNEVYGYLTIPKEWTKLTEDAFQYASFNKSYSVFLDVIDEKNTTIERISENVEKNMKKEMDCTKEKVNLGTYNGYVIKAVNSTGRYVDVYLFRTEDEVIRYIEMEGPNHESEYFKIPETFSLRKTS